MNYERQAQEEDNPIPPDPPFAPLLGIALLVIMVAGAALFGVFEGFLHLALLIKRVVP